MEEHILFQSELTYDLTNHKEFMKVNMQSLCANSIVRLVLVILLTIMLFTLNSYYLLKYFILYAVVLAIVSLIRKVTSRKGDLQYRRLLRSNDERIPHQLVQFQPDGILSRNLDTGKETHCSYSNISFLMESKNLLILVDDLKLCHTLDKRTLTGGSRDELVTHLHRVCPRMKKLHRQGRLGRIVNIFLVLILACGIFYGIAGRFQIPQKLSGQLTNDLSYEEMAQRLSEAGVTISQRAIDEMNDFDADYALKYGEYYLINSNDSKVFDLLYWEGCGVYDETTWEWTPSTSGVYWFDTEVMNLDTIYTDFLRGLDAMDENLSFTNVTEDYSAVDMESGIGIVTFSFDYLGQRYTLNAQYQYDWFDTNMLFHMGRILQQDSDPKALWYTFDGQGVLLYYGTSEDATALEQKTGLILLDPVHNSLYG